VRISPRGLGSQSPRKERINKKELGTKSFSHHHVLPQNNHHLHHPFAWKAMDREQEVVNSTFYNPLVFIQKTNGNLKSRSACKERSD